MQTFSNWFQRRFINTELGNLMLILAVLILIFYFFSNLLIPVLASIVIAYLLLNLVRKLTQWKMSEPVAIHLVYLLFLGLLVFGILILFPLVTDQLSLLINEFPVKLKKAETYINELSHAYPAYVSKEQVQTVINSLQSNFSQIGKNIVSFSFTTLSKIMAVVVYLVLVPLMVYFFMKDYRAILNWMARLLPRKRALIKRVWFEIDEQMGHYISSKILEVGIVGVVTTISFLLLGLNYAVLLGVLVGISALIPYVGVILVTIPVVIVGYMQWGTDIQMLYLSIIYVVLMILDGNILTPLLFSGTMKLHPVAVIIAILIFGGLWGFWGIFFAIPLASVTKVLINACLREDRKTIQRYDIGIYKEKMDPLHRDKM